MVHNHPTGRLLPSDQDVEAHKKLVSLAESIGMKAMPSIIINLDSGKYVEFYDNYPLVKEQKGSSVLGEDKPIDIYSFETQKLYVPSSSKTKISRSRDVATFISQQKRGSIDKIHVIILDRGNSINRYLLVDGKKKPKDLTKLILTEVGRHGEAVILSSNGEIKGLKEIQEALKTINSQLLDV